MSCHCPDLIPTRSSIRFAGYSAGTYTTGLRRTPSPSRGMKPGQPLFLAFAKNTTPTPTRAVPAP